MEIRKAAINDLPGLAELFNEYRLFYKKETDVEGAKCFLNERLAKNESEIFIAFKGNKMTGFVQLYPIFSSTKMKKFWLLNDLFVKAEFRAQGFSKALIERSKELCRQSNACGFMLETAKTNIIGNRLYQQTGLKLDTDYNTYSWEA